MHKTIRSWLGAGLLLAGASAGAVTLPVAVDTALPGTTSALEPHLAGVVLVDETQAFSFAGVGGTVFGSVQSRVIRSTLDGTLDFYWRVFSDIESSAGIASLRLGDFFASSYNANYRTDGLGDTAPSAAFLFAGGMGQVNFKFLTEAIGPGSSSYFLFLDTDATSYARTARYDVTAGPNISDQYSTYAPSAIPEPATLAIVGIGLAGFMLARRRK